MRPSCRRAWRRMSSFASGWRSWAALVLALLVAYNAWTSRRNTPRQPERAGGRAAGRRRAPGPGFDTSLVPPLPLPMPRTKPGLDALIDVLAPIALEGAGVRRRGAGGDAADATRRQQAVRHRRLQRGDAAVGGAAAGPALQRLPGRRAAGQPHRAAQRDRVLGIRRQGAGLCRRRQRRARISRRCSTRWRGRASSTSSPAATTRSSASRCARANAAWSPGYVQQNAARLGFVRRRDPGADGAAGRACRARRRCWACRSTPRPRWPTIRRSRPCANSRSAWTCRRWIAASSRSCACARPRSRWPRPWTASSPTTTARSIRDEALDVIGADLEKLYDTLDSRDLAAGSPLARRLFS